MSKEIINISNYGELIVAINRVNKEDKKSVLNVIGDIVIDRRNFYSLDPREMKKELIGMVFGPPPILKNCMIVGNGHKIIVDKKIPFIRLTKGGDRRDIFVIALNLIGKNICISELEIVGNINKRNVIKGVGPIGYGGMDYGIFANGNDWILDGCVVSHFGTDNVMVRRTGFLENCTLIGGRRNGISVVNIRPGSRINVNIENCDISYASRYDRTIFNNPGAGVHVEGKAMASVKISNSKIYECRTDQVRLSTNAIACSISNSKIHGTVQFRKTRGGELGGHLFDKRLLLDPTFKVIGNPSHYDYTHFK